MLDAIQKAVIGRLVSDDAKSKASKTLTAGDHEVDFMIRVKGTFKKGTDFEQEISNKVDHKSLFAVALDEMRKAGLKVELSDLVKASLTATAKERAKEVDIETKAVMNVVQGPTLTQCHGKVTGVKALEVSVIETGEESLQTA